MDKTTGRINVLSFIESWDGWRAAIIQAARDGWPQGWILSVGVQAGDFLAMRESRGLRETGAFSRAWLETPGEEKGRIVEQLMTEALVKAAV